LGTPKQRIEGRTLRAFETDPQASPAASPTQVITFHDEKAAPGEELIINFIQLKPYLE